MLKSASVLVADAVAEVLPQWETDVLPLVLKLCDETLPLFSHGFGPGVSGNFVGWWCISVGWLASFLQDGTFASAMFTVLTVLWPLGVSYDAASASSDCGLLSDALIEKHMRGAPSDLLFEHAINRVEKILDRQNAKQGLGFTVGYRVMDLKTLGNILATIAGVASTVVPILFSLRSSMGSIGTDDACELTTTEITTIQSLMSRNETCAYNITINEILGM